MLTLRHAKSTASAPRAERAHHLRREVAVQLVRHGQLHHVGHVDLERPVILLEAPGTLYGLDHGLADRVGRSALPNDNHCVASKLDRVAAPRFNMVKDYAEHVVDGRREGIYSLLPKALKAIGEPRESRDVDHQHHQLL
jgi:hypothetical protein